MDLVGNTPQPLDRFMKREHGLSHDRKTKACCFFRAGSVDIASDVVFSCGFVFVHLGKKGFEFGFSGDEGEHLERSSSEKTIILTKFPTFYQTRACCRQYILGVEQLFGSEYHVMMYYGSDPDGSLF